MVLPCLFAVSSEGNSFLTTDAIESTMSKRTLRSTIQSSIEENLEYL